MLEKFPTSDIIAISVVIAGLVILGYLSIKTLITSNLFQKGINFYQTKDYENAEIVFRKVIAILKTGCSFTSKITKSIDIQRFLPGQKSSSYPFPVYQLY
jgi:hypothetical protein